MLRGVDTWPGVPGVLCGAIPREQGHQDPQRTIGLPEGCGCHCAMAVTSILPLQWERGPLGGSHITCLG